MLGYKDRALKIANNLVEMGTNLAQCGKPDIRARYEWVERCISFVINTVGEGDHYYHRFISAGSTSKVGLERRLALMKALTSDIEDGYFLKFRTLMSAEILTDFLEMAEHLLDQSYKDPAAMLAGAVLEDGLRRICRNKNIAVTKKDDISSLNQKIANGGIYSRLVQKKAQVWGDIRNNAAHGKFEQYDAKDVASMIPGVRDFLAEYLERSS